jgi:hypothetical protein
MLYRQEDSIEVDGGLPAPVGKTDVYDRKRANGDPGVGYEDIESSEAFLHLPDQFDPPRFLRHILMQIDRDALVGYDLIDDSLPANVVDVRRNHPGTGLRKARSTGRPDA